MIKKIEKIIATAIVANLIVIGLSVSAQFGGPFDAIIEQLFYTDGTGIFPSNSSAHLGSNTTRIAKGWFNDLDVDTAFKLGGTVATGGIDMNGELIYNIASTSNPTSFRSDGGLTMFGDLRMATSTYANFGSATSSSGYGIRDNSGTLELKNDGGSWAPIGAGSFAEIHIYDNSTATTITTSSEWYSIDEAEWHEDNVQNWSATTSDATNTHALVAGDGAVGTYIFMWTISATPAGTNETYQFAIFIDDATSTNSLIERKFATADIGTPSAAGIISITNGNVIELKVRSTSGTDNITIKHANLSLHQM